MKPPFTLQQLLEVFEAYNRAVSFAPFALVVFASVVVGMLFSKYLLGHGIIAYLLSLLWLWMGVAYHVVFFSRINPAALPFGGMFIFQSVLFIAAGARGWVRFEAKKNLRTVAGAGAMAYGLVIYPIIGEIVGHGYPIGPVFGAPCPTTVFTVGVLLNARQAYTPILLLIPALWSLIALQVVSLGLVENIALPLSALIAVTFRWFGQERVR